jgi:hypothetical protein
MNIPGIGLTLHAGGVDDARMTGVVTKQNYIGLQIG